MANVHTGRWTDWSKGPVLGAQITLTNARGNILVAFIAVFITFVGGVTWGMLAYLLHQVNVSEKPRDGLHYQILAMLRNRYSPDTFAFKMLEMGFAWRKRPVRLAILRTAGFALFALLVYAVFIAAGIFLSTVASTGDVLLLPSNCGTFDWALAANASEAVSYTFDYALSAWSAEDYSQAYSYSEACYGVDQTDNYGYLEQLQAAPASNCGFYVKPSLNWTTSLPSECPFVDASLCKGSNIVRFDTGYLDTRADLGKNTRDEDRLLFRRTTTCSPMSTDGYASDGFVQDPNMGNVAIYNYGVNEAQAELTPEFFFANATFYYSYESFVANNQAYQLMITSTDIQGSNGQAPFVPDPRVASNGTSVEMIFLANRAVYNTPVNDPWFQATTALTNQSSPTLSARYGPPDGTYYYSTEPGSVLGCINQVEVCNPSLPSSSRCISWPDYAAYSHGTPSNSLDALNLNAHQTDMADSVANLLYNSGYWTILNTLGTSALTASDFLYGFGSVISLTLPDNQWIAELQRLQAASMALLQRDSFIRVEGPTDPRLMEFLSVNNDDWQCSLQKFRSDAYMSFSVLGLGLIFGIGGFILILGILLTVVAPAIQKRSGGAVGMRLRRQWYENDLLYLQKTVMEDRGLGKWEGAIESIPTTADGAKILPCTDKNCEGMVPGWQHRDEEKNHQHHRNLRDQDSADSLAKRGDFTHSPSEDGIMSFSETTTGHSSMTNEKSNLAGHVRPLLHEQPSNVDSGNPIIREQNGFRKMNFFS